MTHSLEHLPTASGFVVPSSKRVLRPPLLEKAKIEKQKGMALRASSAFFCVPKLITQISLVSLPFSYKHYEA